MKFGVREIANVVFKAKRDMKLGKSTFKKGQPVLYIDSAKTTTMEGAATTVYATGGRGNTRLLAWEGEKTLTVTVEDALISPIGFSILSGAGLFSNDTTRKVVHIHKTAYVEINGDQQSEATTTDPATYDNVYFDLTSLIADGETLDKTEENFFVMLVDESDSIEKSLFPISGEGSKIINYDKTNWGSEDTTKGKYTFVADGGDASSDYNSIIHKKIFVDFYVTKPITNDGIADGVTELQIDAEHFGEYFYVEADTLFRRDYDAADLPALLTYPKVKIQSNFTFTMSSSGDPSTFTFTMDAMPDYTKFDQTKKVLCVMQIVDNEVTDGSGDNYVM